MCPDIKKVDIYINTNFTTITNEMDILLKVEYIKELYFDENNSHLFELLVEKYRTTLKGLKLRELSSDELKTCFAHISRFESLESLDFVFRYSVREEIEEYLKQLANNCTKLRDLRLYISRLYSWNKSFINSNRIFFALSDFRSLERLVIDFDYNTQQLEGSVECLKHMTSLKHLSITYSELTLDFFDNIQTFVPNLRYLDIESRKLTFDGIKPFKQFAESLQTMKSLERVVIRYKVSIKITDRF